MNTINISIIGLGLIGGSIAKALKSSNKEIYITAYDREEVLESALLQKVIDKKAEYIENAADADIIFLCLPTDISLQTLEKLAPSVNENTIITDVAGVKSAFENKWSSLKSKGEFVGGHPMTGKEKGGFENSDPLLFENSVYILSDNKKQSPNYNKLIKLIELLGARIKFLDPYLHDEIIANVSHLPQLLSVALVNSAACSKNDTNYLDFAAGGFRDMTRIASSNFDIWEPVIKNNKEAILKALENFETNAKVIKENILADDFKTLADYFESARAKRDDIPKNTKGFINPLVDVFVFVKDEPGVLSRLTTILFEDGISIKDIELLKIREGTGGTFRLSVQSKEEAERAEKLIHGLGFRTK
ncbi:MAG: prephenate dehydrogenase [Ignavibacteriaceae bacterium]